MSYCINPNCHQSNISNSQQRFCPNCRSSLLLQNYYRVSRLLSDDSGFGTIYEVNDRGKQKILKVLKNFTPKAVELFQQEAKILGDLNHPGIPQIDGYFIYSPSNHPSLHCLMMEKIEGMNLQEWLQEENGNKPIGEKQALDWLKQIAQILKIVHQRQYFHRDLKPANIMLRPNGKLALIDFGTAREITATYLGKVGGDNGITSINSPGYTPLEQVNGKAVPQSDFYALGRTFVFLLTGRRPTLFTEDRDNGNLLWRDSAIDISPLLGDFIDELMYPFPGMRPINAEAIIGRIEQIEKQLSSPVPINIGSEQEFNSNSSSLKINNQPIKQRRVKGVFNKLLLGGGIAVLLGIGAVSIYFDLKNRPNNRTLFPNRPSSSERSFRSIEGHSDLIFSVAFSPNGEILASGSGDNKIKLWDWKTGTELKTLAGHQNDIKRVVFSPDSTLLASASQDNLIKLWNWQEGREIKSLVGHEDGVLDLAFSPDSLWLASGSQDKTIKIWNLIDGKVIYTLKGHNARVLSVAFSPDGKILASGSYDNTIKLWSLEDGSEISTINGHLAWVSSLKFSPDGKILASSSGDKTIKLWNWENGEEIRTLESHYDQVTSVTFSPDGRTLASASGGLDNTVKVWNINNGKEITTLKGHTGSVESIAFSPDGKILASGSWDKTIKLWELEKN